MSATYNKDSIKLTSPLGEKTFEATKVDFGSDEGGSGSEGGGNNIIDYKFESNFTASPIPNLPFFARVDKLSKEECDELLKYDIIRIRTTDQALPRPDMPATLKKATVVDMYVRFSNIMPINRDIPVYQNMYINTAHNSVLQITNSIYSSSNNNENQISEVLNINKIFFDFTKMTASDEGYVPSGSSGNIVLSESVALYILYFAIEFVYLPLASTSNGVTYEKINCVDMTNKFLNSINIMADIILPDGSKIENVKTSITMSRSDNNSAPECLVYAKAFTVKENDVVCVELSWNIDDKYIKLKQITCNAQE